MILMFSAIVYAEEDISGGAGQQTKSIVENGQVSKEDSDSGEETDSAVEPEETLDGRNDLDSHPEGSRENLEEGGDTPEDKASDTQEMGMQQEADASVSANTSDASVEVIYGWHYDEVDQKWYYYNQQGVKQYGWLRWSNRQGTQWDYLDPNNAQYPGAMVVDCKLQGKSATYFFDAQGIMQVGWVYRQGEGWYYTDSSGAMSMGWKYINGKWYYLDPKNANNPGLMVSNCKMEVYGVPYFFNNSGVMEVGWVYRRGEGYYYTNQSGAQLMGWHKEGSKWYYLDPNNAQFPGLMLANCETNIGGLPYGFDKSGAMWSGWIKKADGWRYYDAYSGQSVRGWKLVSGQWYYMNPSNNNIMVSGGWYKVGNLWYYFNGNGSMATGWLYLNGLWYYLGTDGSARTGWMLIGGGWDYFYKANDPNGGKECAMARNVTINGWRLSSSGAMVLPEALKMHERAQIYSSSTNYLILVDRAACKVGIYTGKAGFWNQTKFWSCSPGKPSTPTVAGTFKVGIKGYYFDSGSSRCFWYTQFRGNYLFHSVLYRKTSKPSQIIDGRIGMQLSHGCVRLDINNAKWIYDNIPQGTTVVVY